VSGTTDITVTVDDDGNPSDDLLPEAGCPGASTGVNNTNNSSPIGGSQGVPNVSSGSVGYGKAPKTAPPNSSYTQISSDGKNTIVSQTQYNEYGLRGTRIDYFGRDHGYGLPHIHRYTYGWINGNLYQIKTVTDSL
jgi:hypothetical protein